MVACKLSVHEQTKWLDLPLDCAGLPQKDRKICETDHKAKKDWREARQMVLDNGGTYSEGGITYMITKEGWLVQHQTDFKEGVAETIITALDFNPPFVASLFTDLQGVPPLKREALMRELAEACEEQGAAT